MRMRRFYVPTDLGGHDSKSLDNNTHILSSPELVHQLKNVFRLKRDEEIVLFNNTNRDFLVKIKSIEKDSFTFTVLSSTENTVTPNRETYLFASLVKKDNFEWIAQKATELGVSHIIPILSSRSEKKDLNIERIKKIIIEAAEQSGRGTLPVLEEIISLEEALEKYKNIKSVAWHIEAPKFVSQNLEGVIGAYVGPEGGWSPEDLELFKKQEVPCYSLGPQVLRAETAVIAIISQMVF